MEQLFKLLKKKKSEFGNSDFTLTTMPATMTATPTTTEATGHNTTSSLSDTLFYERLGEMFGQTNELKRLFSAIAKQGVTPCNRAASKLEM
ncbi:hypothetical protein ACI7RC_25385 [Brevibacillus sp. B_LB10_24]|uniref:hypothetical protein n=1 Tax=Brevibacillus sp. B_LB10_24 TaxID=3380645 RepID=UPI0038BAEBD4